MYSQWQVLENGQSAKMEAIFFWTIYILEIADNGPRKHITMFFNIDKRFISVTTPFPSVTLEAAWSNK